MKFTSYMDGHKSWTPHIESEEEAYEHAEKGILEGSRPGDNVRVIWKVTYEPLYVVKLAGVVVDELPESLRSDS